MSTTTLDLAPTPQTSTAQPPTALETAIAWHQHELRTQGWTIFPRLMSAAHLAAMRKEIDDHIARPGTVHDSQTYGCANLIAWNPAFGEVATDPLLLGTIEGLIGSDCILSSCNLAARRPGCAAPGCHRDTSIWGPSMPFMPFPVGIQTAWCVDEFTLENGATVLIPGSHADPTIPSDAPAVQAVAPAGSVIAFDCQALHAGGGNRSQALRRAVLTLYIRSWLKPQTDHKRSFPRERWATASTELLQLLGYRRQSPVEHADGRSEYLEAPGATNFYGGRLTGPAAY